MAIDHAAENLEETVALLVNQHFIADVAEAVQEDEAFDRLVEACAGISSGDPASISMVFREVSPRYDNPAELDAFLDDDSPAGCLAAVVSAHYNEIRRGLDT